MIRSNRVLRFVAVAAVSLGSVVTGAAVASASPVAHAPQPPVVAKGTITVVTPSSGTPTSFTIQPLSPSAPTENIVLSATTVYRQNGVTVSVSALAVGEPVAVVLTGTPATAAVVRILTPAPVIIAGTVSALSPSSGTPTSMTVQPANLHRPTLNIALGTGTLYYLGGTATTITSLVVGSHVVLEATGTPATATVVEIALPRPIHILGSVTAIDTANSPAQWFTVLPAGHNSLAVNVGLSSTTVFRQGGVVVSLANLLVGSKVNVTASGSPLSASLVQIAVPHPVIVEGMVTALNPSSGTPTSLTVQPFGAFKTPVSIALSSSTEYFQSGAATTVATLLVGSRVELSATGNPLTASVIHIAAPLPVVTLGSVTAVSSTSLTVQPTTTGSSPVTFSLTNATNYFSGRRVATLAAVNVGDVVRVTATTADPTTAVSVTVRQMVIIGRVSAVAGNVISVTGFYGTALTVNVTGATTYTLKGQPSSLAAVLAGDMVVAIGPAMSGVTTSVTASHVWIGTLHNLIWHLAVIQHREAVERHHR